MISADRLSERSVVARVAIWLVVASAVLLRVPSLAQPPGGDQGLYAYVGQQMANGGIPYRDAWDQKPPAIHATFALMWRLWPSPHVVAATDAIVSLGTAWLLYLFARRLSGSSGTALTVAVLYLVLANPVHTRLGGVRIRAQCETFIGLWVAAGLLVLQRAADRRDITMHDASVRLRWTLLGGVCLGAAAAYKYNAATAVLPAGLALLIGCAARRESRPLVSRLVRAFVPLALGVALPLLLMVAAFAAAGALDDLYHATISYNVFYSGETYRSATDILRYVITFPLEYARVDSLWWMGGLGCLILLVRSISDPRLLVVPAWVAAACLSIAVNGSRGLPQYFVQAWPPLALAAGLGLAWIWRQWGPLPRIAMVAALSIGIWRVTPIPKAVDYLHHDWMGLTGQIAHDRYLERFGRRESGDKFSALAIEELAAYLRANTRPNESVLIFGFSPFAHVLADRPAATRFFWSRPVIVGFREGTPGYGPTGMLAELQQRAPAVVVLQQHDWDPDGPDSYTFFLSTPSLRAWLDANYRRDTDLGNYAIWRRIA